MKVVQITNLYPPFARGGAEIYVENLVKALSSGSADNVYVITNVRGREFKDRRIINLNLRNSDALTSLLIPNFLIYKKIKKFLSELQPDIVHVHNIHATLSSAAVFASRGFPLVMTVHDFYLFCPTLRFVHEDGKICAMDKCITCMKKYYSSEIKKRWGACRIFSGMLRSDMFCRLLYEIRKNRLKRIIPLIDKFICPNKSQKELLKVAGVPEDKLTTLPYTSDFKVKEIARPEGKYIGYAGGLIREKGVHVLLEALSLLPEDTKLLIAGDGIFKNELVRMSGNLGIKNRVRFLGKLGRDEMRSFYDKIHVLVVPSLWPEVLGIVGLEAMTSGKPVIGSNIGGIPDWIEDGVNGFLVPPDSPKSLAEKAMTLFNTEDMIYKFGLNGQKKFTDEFSPEVHKNKIINLYRKLLHGHNIN